MLAASVRNSLRSSTPTSRSPTVLPVPHRGRFGRGGLRVDARFTVALVGAAGDRVLRAADRLLRRWEERTTLEFSRNPDGSRHRAGRRDAGLVLTASRTMGPYPALGDDESYRLRVGSRQVVLHATMELGLLRGLATLEQLLESDEDGWFLPMATVHDRPRFPWRGLLLDVCRHWHPLEAVKRQLEAMALVKLNVLHLHLTEDQGFRVESRQFPRLHQLGSDGCYFRQAELRELVEFAADRGIRVVPEFDLPGHVTSWLVGHPELASAPGPYQIRRGWGVAEAALDPTNDALYAFLDRFMGEMASVFPDAYVHIGGDEVKARHWNESPRIQRFIRDRGLKDNRGLQAHFNRRMSGILRRHGKAMVGWDEVLHPRLPRGAVVQSWRGADGLAAATRQGFSGLLSHGYYLDLWWPARQHYAVDPVPADSTLTRDQRRRILGGEAALWSEWVTEERLDACLWPRAAAVAERLWSPRTVVDADDLYRRLAVLRQRLEELGLQHDRNREAMLRRYAATAHEPRALQALRAIAAVFEPVKNYGRNAAQPKITSFSPLNRFVDLLEVESDQARRWYSDGRVALFSGARRRAAWLAALADQERCWKEAAATVDRAFQGSPWHEELAPCLAALRQALLLLRSCRSRLRGEGGTARWRQAVLRRLDAALAPCGSAELGLGPLLRMLVAVAGSQGRRGGRKAALSRASLLAWAEDSRDVNAPVYETHL